MAKTKKDCDIFKISEKRANFFLAEIHKLRLTRIGTLDLIDKIFTKNLFKANAKELNFLCYILGKVSNQAQTIHSIEGALPFFQNIFQPK
jgi:hypothetical protein